MPDGRIQGHKTDCEEFRALSDALCQTIRAILDLIVTFLIHLSAGERIQIFRYSEKITGICRTHKDLIEDCHCC